MEKLLFLSNVPGICRSNGKVISEVTEAQTRWLIEDEVITGGMLPKVQACLDALASVPSRARQEARQHPPALGGEQAVPSNQAAARFHGEKTGSPPQEPAWQTGS
jgi:acetylglutamate kinase